MGTRLSCVAQVTKTGWVVIRRVYCKVTSLTACSLQSIEQFGLPVFTFASK